MKIITAFASRAGELIQARDRTKKGFLANVFRIAGIAGHTKSGEKQPGGVGHDKSRKGFAIAQARIREKVERSRSLGGSTSLRAQRSSLVMLAAEADNRRIHLKAEGSSAHGRSKKGRQAAMVL